MKPVLAGLLSTCSLVLSLGAAGCSLGQGEGGVHSDLLYAKDCWCSTYNLRPDFFAAVPYRETLQIRVQRGTDLQEVSDGLAVQVDNVNVIRESYKGKKLKVALASAIEPLGVAPNEGSNTSTLSKGCGPDDSNPGVDNLCDFSSRLGGAEEANEGAPLVHMALYLQQSCHNQNTVLYAVSGSIVFESLFSGDPNESVAADKYTKAVFEVKVGDLQELPAGAKQEDFPPEKLTELKGCFQFYFERGQPGQPFP